MGEVLGPILSIIIPVYNAELYIERCLKSILCSQECRFEVIVIDDGSKDQSLRICREFECMDQRIHVYTQKNGGVSTARNHGLHYAKGKYITFCDADDYYVECGIDLLIDMLSQNRSELFLMAFYQQQENAETLIRRISGLCHDKKMPIESIKNDFWTLLNGGMLNAPWNKMYLRERIESLKLRFREDVAFSEDGIFNVNYLNNISDIVYIDRPIYNYVIHPGQVSQKRVNNFYYMMCQAYDCIDAFISKDRLDEKYWQEWFCVIKNTFYHQNGDLSNADEILDTKRTKELMVHYTPVGLFDRVVFYCLKKRKLKVINRLIMLRRSCSRMKRMIKMARNS